MLSTLARVDLLGVGVGVGVGVSRDQLMEFLDG